MENDVNLTVSPVCSKDGKNYAFVTFSEGGKTAEGKIPDCKIIANKGFSQEEVEQMEYYMTNELPKLKRMAAGIRLIDVLGK